MYYLVRRIPEGKRKVLRSLLSSDDSFTEHIDRGYLFSSMAEIEMLCGHHLLGGAEIVPAHKVVLLETLRSQRQYARQCWKDSYGACRDEGYSITSAIEMLNEDMSYILIMAEIRLVIELLKKMSHIK